MPRRASVFVFLGLAIALVFVTGISAGAEPGGSIREKKAEVAAAQDRLMEIRMEASAAQASYNNALYEMNQLNEQMARTRDDLDAAKKRVAEAKENLEERAAQVYKSGNVAFMDVLVGVDNFSEFASRLDLWVRLLDKERTEFLEFREARNELAARRDRLAAEREQRIDAVETAIAQKKRADKAEAQAEAYLNSLTAELRDAIQAAQDRQAEQSRAAIAAVVDKAPAPAPEDAPATEPEPVPVEGPEPTPEVQVSQVDQVQVPKPDLQSEQAAAEREAAAQAAAAEAKRLAEQRAAEREAARKAAERAAEQAAAQRRAATLAAATRQEARVEAQRQAELAAQRAAERQAARQEAERQAELAARRAAAEEAAAEQAAAERQAARFAAERRADRQAEQQAEARQEARAAEASASASAAAAEEAAAEQAAAESASASASASATTSASAPSSQNNRRGGGGGRASSSPSASTSTSASASASASAPSSQNSRRGGGGGRVSSSAGATASAPAAASGSRASGGGVGGSGYDVLAVAQEHLGTPYVLSPPGPCSAFKSEDCACFTMLVFQEFGIALPDSPGAQMGYGTPVRGAPQAGDLLFWSENGSGAITHVGIAMGDGTTIHASNYTGEVSITGINYIRGYVGARRVL